MKEEKGQQSLPWKKAGVRESGGPLSENNAWRAGSFWLEMGQSVKVFLEKDGSRKDVEVLKRFEKGREKIWFKEKTANPNRKRTKTMVRPSKKRIGPWAKTMGCNKTRPRRSKR